MNPLEQHLKDRFADASAPVSPAGQDALWVAVEGSLDGKRNRGAFWFVLGGLFATALSIVAIWYLRAPADADQLAWAGATAPTTFKGMDPNRLCGPQRAAGPGCRADFGGSRSSHRFGGGGSDSNQRCTHHRHALRRGRHAAVGCTTAGCSGGGGKHPRHRSEYPAADP